MGWRLSERAERDLIEIYVAGTTLFGVGQAERYHAGLLNLFDLLAEQPDIARLRREFVPPVRLHPHGAHLVVYVERAGGVERADGIVVVRLLHRRQDWMQALEG